MELQSETTQMVSPLKLPVLKTGDYTLVASASASIEGPIPPKIAKQKLARKNKLKAKSTLMLAIPDEHLLKFHACKDAKSLWEAIKNRFGGNKESKKMQKTILKQNYENFAASSQEEDANLKLLRSLPSAWNNIALIMRNKSDLDTLSMDDLYNNLKVYESEIKGQSSSNSNSQNVAFVSLDNTSSTNETVNTVHSVSAANLEQIDADDLKEMDLKWQVAMLTMRVKRFIKKTRRKMDLNDKETVGFDSTKVKCYNCHRRGHFVRECRAPRNQENRNRDAPRRNALVDTSTTNTLVVQDGIGGYDWSFQAEEGITNFALMAYTSQGSSSSSSSYSKREALNKSNLEIISYQMGLESLEARIVVHKKNESVYEEDIAFLKYDVQVKDISIKELKNQLENALNEKDNLKLKLEKFETSSKNLTKLINSQIIAKDKTGLGFDEQVNKSEVLDNVFDNRESDGDDNLVGGYHVVPPPYTGNYMSSRPDLSFAGLDDSVYKTKVSETETGISKTSKDIVEEPKTVRPSTPIIEEWDTDSDNDSVFRPKSDQTKPKFTNINFVKYGENVKSINKENTHRQVEYPRKSQSPKGNRRNWNGVMTQKLGNGFEFIKKACFVCGSFNHLIKDFETITQRVNHQNKLTPPHPKRNLFQQQLLQVRDKCQLMLRSQRLLRAATSIISDAVGNGENVVQGIFGSRCSRHMTGNKSFLTDYQEINGGFVAFAGSPKGGKITGKGKIRTRKLGKHLKTNILFSVTLIVFVLFSWTFKLLDVNSSLLKVPRHDNMYSFDLKNVDPSGGLNWIKGIKREFSVARTLQQNGVVERKNRTLIQVARTMLADSLLPTTFWAESSSMLVIVQNRVLVTKPHNKTPYELLHGRPPSISFMRPFGCPVTILNTLYPLGKFDRKANEGFFVGYSINGKAFRGEFQTNKNAGIKDNVDAVPTQQYILLPLLYDSPQSSEDAVADDAGKKTNEEPANEGERNGQEKEGGASNKEGDQNVQDFRAELDNFLVQQKEGYANSTNRVSTVSPSVSDVGQSFDNADDLLTDPLMPDLEDTVDLLNTGIFSGAYDDDFFKEAMQEELLQFKSQKVWTLVNLPNGKSAIGTKWVFRKKKDERGIAVRNKARLVAQGYTQEEGIDYDKVFAPIARIEAIRLFLAYASFMGFIVYQMDVKSVFLYGTIDEEGFGLCVHNLLVLEDPRFLDKVIIRRGTIDKTLFIKKDKGDILLVQMSSMGELTFFLGLQVKQKDDGIFISQDKYVADILKKFDFVTVKTTSTPIETNKALLKDEEAKDVDVHLYRSMIRSLMYLTASRPDIMFAVCAWARFQVTPKVSHLHVVKRIFRYLKGQPKLGLWYPRDSPFDLEAFFDSDYAGASLDRKSTTREQEITAIVDGKEFTITEASIGRHLQLADVEGSSALPTTEIFDQLSLMREHTPLFPSMLAIQAEEGEGLGHPSEPQPPPSNAQPTYEEPIPNTSVPIPNVADKAIFKEWDDRVVRATTTPTSLDVAQATKTQSTAIPNVPLPQRIGAGGSPRCQEAIGGSIAQTRSERVPTSPYDSPLPRVNTLGELGDRLEVNKEDDEEDLEDFSKQGRMIEEIDQDAGITLVTPTKDTKKNVNTYTRRRMAVSTGNGEVSTASRLFSTAEESVSTTCASMPVSTVGMVQEVNISIPSPVIVKDKGKGIITYSGDEQTKRTKIQQEQDRLGHEAAVRLQEELDEEERQRMARVHAAAQSFIEGAEVELDHEGFTTDDDVSSGWKKVMLKLKSIIQSLAGRCTLKTHKVLVNYQSGNHTEAYQIFADMLKKFDRDDLVKL
ncbi:putative ribonuclease H-like domain-containing protein [Tanacetum coccineum]